MHRREPQSAPPREQKNIFLNENALRGPHGEGSRGLPPVIVDSVLNGIPGIPGLEPEDKNMPPDYPEVEQAIVDGLDGFNKVIQRYEPSYFSPKIPWGGGASVPHSSWCAQHAHARTKCPRVPCAVQTFALTGACFSWCCLCCCAATPSGVPLQAGRASQNISCKSTSSTASTRRYAASHKLPPRTTTLLSDASSRAEQASRRGEDCIKPWLEPR